MNHTACTTFAVFGKRFGEILLKWLHACWLHLVASAIDQWPLTTLKSLGAIIGASMIEPLSSDLNVNFVCQSICLSVCLSVCHGPHGPSTYRKPLPALILHVLRHALKTTREFEVMNHGQSWQSYPAMASVHATSTTCSVLDQPVCSMLV